MVPMVAEHDNWAASYSYCTPHRYRSRHFYLFCMHLCVLKPVLTLFIAFQAVPCNRFDYLRGPTLLFATPSLSPTSTATSRLKRTAVCVPENQSATDPKQQVRRLAAPCRGPAPVPARVPARVPALVPAQASAMTRNFVFPLPKTTWKLHLLFKNSSRPVPSQPNQRTNTYRQSLMCFCAIL